MAGDSWNAFLKRVLVVQTNICCICVKIEEWALPTPMGLQLILFF